MNHPIPAVHRKWREVFDQFQASGLSMAAFCRQHGIAKSSFFAWRRRLGPGHAAPVFVEAKMSGEVPAARPAGGAIEIRLRGGRRVRVSRDGFDRELLADVLAVLEGRS